MINKISFHGYLFKEQPGHIIRYEILFRSERKFLVKYTCLDGTYVNPTAEITVNLCQTLPEAIAVIINFLRTEEIEHGVYKELTRSDKLPEYYHPLVDELSSFCRDKGVRTFTFFGHLCKYRPRTAARNVLASMGYLVPSTKRPHIYVLDEFVREELATIHGKS